VIGEIFSGGRQVSGTVQGGATQFVLGSATNMLVSGTGAVQQVFGSVTSTTVGSGAIEIVNVGASDSASLIQSGGTQFDSATVVSATIASGGVQHVYGSASATLVSGTNALESVEVGGGVTGAVLQSGGQEFVFGTTSNTAISAGSFQFVEVGGIARGATVSGVNAFEIVLGGTVSDTIVSSGGNVNVSSGGTTSNAVVFGGGKETVSSGATLVGATLSGGGMVEIVSGGTAGASTINISSGTLILDDSQHFSGSIAGLLVSGAQVVDLADIQFATAHLVGYSSSGGGNTSGTLTVADSAGHTALLNMIGTYTIGSFKLSADNGSGTLVTDPPVSSGNGIAAPH
jgi:autotransporter passenger strand-loop-strand repeat protein